jgi:hypothetical chaperone protein
VRVGIDFGTTNSAVAVLGSDGQARIVELAPGEKTQRTVIFSDGPRVLFGNAAFAAYLENDLQGRFLRSLKAFLPDDVPRTFLGSRWYDFVQLVGAYLRFLIDGAERATGERVTEVTIGRPVRFNEDPDKHDRALAQLEAAIREARLPPHRLQLEPIAAALRHEASVTQERRVLVGDFGGGTADFAILRIGPARRGRDREEDVLATAGVALAGDALDGRFVTRFLLPDLGWDAEWTDPDRGNEIRRWRPTILEQVPKLYDVHRHRDRVLAELLDRMEPRMRDPRVIRRLRRLVFDDLGYPMAQAIELSKRALSAEDVVEFRFDEYYHPQLNLRRDVSRAEFAEASDEILSKYGAAVDGALAKAGLGTDEIDEVFLTGGTSQLPFVRQLFVDRFGADKLRGADAFTSVCEGLALS